MAICYQKQPILVNPDDEIFATKFSPPPAAPKF